MTMKLTVHAAEHSPAQAADSPADSAGAPALSRFRLDTLQRSDVVFELRDFCRRVGLHAEVRSPTTVEIQSAAPKPEVDEHLAEWLRVTGVELRVTPLDRTLTRLEPPPVLLMAPRIGELLIRKGFLTQAQLDWALGEARETKDLLGVVLLRSKLIFEDELARTLSVQLSIPYIGIKQIGVNPYVARLLPPDVGEAVAAIPVRDGAQSVQVVFADPTDPQALDAVRRHLPEIEVAVAELSDIRLAWRAIAG